MSPPCPPLFSQRRAEFSGLASGAGGRFWDGRDVAVLSYQEQQSRARQGGLPGARGAAGAACEAPEGTGCSSRTGCTRSPAFPSPGKPEQQEKLRSCPGEREGSVSAPAELREDAGMCPQGESILGQLCPGDSRAGAAKSGACTVPAAPKGLSVAPRNKTTRKSLGMDALLCKGLKSRQIHPSLLPSAQPLSGGGENSFRSAERNLASALMDGDPGDPGAVTSLVRGRGLAPGSDTPVLPTGAEQPQISQKDRKAICPVAAEAAKQLAETWKVGKTPNPRAAARQGCPGLETPVGSRAGVWGCPNTFSMGCDSREGARDIPGALQGTEPWEGREREKQEWPQQHRGHAKPQPIPAVTPGSFAFCSVFFDGGQGRTNSWEQKPPRAEDTSAQEGLREQNPDPQHIPSSPQRSIYLCTLNAKSSPLTAGGLWGGS